MELAFFFSFIVVILFIFLFAISHRMLINKYRNLRNSLPDIVLEIKNGKISKSIDEKIFNITGFSREEVLNNDIFSFLEPRQRIKCLINIRKKNKGVYVEPFDIHLNSKEGKKLFFSVNLGSVKNCNNNYILVILSDITEKVIYQEELLKQALTDSLTNIPNRKLFYSRVEYFISKSKRTNSSFYVLFIDLDDFKSINDSYGHAAGDKALQQTANTLVSCVRASDTVARMGGDEFAILLDINNNDGINSVKQKIRKGMSEPLILLIEGQPVSVKLKLSYGVARYPNDGISADEIINKSDDEMYTNKNKKKSICMDASKN